MSSATSAVKNMGDASVNRGAFLPFNNTNLMLLHHRRSLLWQLPTLTVGSQLCFATTTGREWRARITVECAVWEHTSTLLSVLPAPFVFAMAAETALLLR